jgi:DNA-binding protein HU-beta
MNKKEFKKHISTLHDCTMQEAEKVIEMFTGSVTAVLGNGGEVSLTGFGNFSVSQVPARDGYNPKTKEPLKIAAYNHPKFKAGKKLKDACNE